MKQILLFSVLLLAFFNIQAQSAGVAPDTNDDAIRATTNLLVTKYSLNADQAKQMYTIQQRKERNLKAIESIRQSAPKTYYGKLEGIQNSTANSIRRILKTKEQVTIYRDTQSSLRKKRAELTKTLVQSGKNRDEIKVATLDIYEE